MTTKLHAAGLTAETLAGLERISDPRPSPDERMIIYDVRTTDWAANKGVHSIWIVDAAGTGAPRRLVGPQIGASSARWAEDGQSILFIAPDRAGTDQVWRAPVCANECSAEALRQVTHLPIDVGTFRAADALLIVSLAVFPDCPDLKCTSARLAEGKANSGRGVVFDRLFVRHWDAWADGRRNHLFLVARDGLGATDLMPGFDGDVPTKPDGGDDDFAVTADNVYFSARIAGQTEAWSINFDIFRVPLVGGGVPENLTSANKAWDAGPVLSPDGLSLAYRATNRPGFEADRFAVMVMNLATGRVREVGAGFDRSAEALAWSSDGRSLIATVQDVQERRIFSVDISSGRVVPLSGAGSVADVRVVGAMLVYSVSSLTAPAQLVRLMPGSTPVQLTHANDAVLGRVAMGAAEPFTFTGWNGDIVHGYVVKPADFDPAKRYPVAFLIHGGPQDSFGNAWSYRWNPQTHAGLGFAVVMIDFHGSAGYGQAFTDAVSRHWGDRPLVDLRKGWAAALSRYKFLDRERACALGGSYGGFMIAWIASQWSEPWRCFVNHDGIFDTVAWAHATDELWSSEWDFGCGMAGERSVHARFNPSGHVAKWTTPMLVIHGGKDYRVPLEQSIGAFSALQRRGIPSRFLYLEAENHLVLSPRNSVQWHGVVGEWIERWTGAAVRPLGQTGRGQVRAQGRSRSMARKPSARTSRPSGE